MDKKRPAIILDGKRVRYTEMEITHDIAPIAASMDNTIRIYKSARMPRHYMATLEWTGTDGRKHKSEARLIAGHLRQSRREIMVFSTDLSSVTKRFSYKITNDILREG